jgi:hypothetical protein
LAVVVNPAEFQITVTCVHKVMNKFAAMARCRSARRGRKWLAEREAELLPVPISTLWSHYRHKSRHRLP